MLHRFVAVRCEKEAAGGAAFFGVVAAARSVAGDVAARHVGAADVASDAEAIDEPADSDTRRRSKRVRPAGRTSRNATGALRAEEFVATRRLHRVAHHFEADRTEKLFFWQRHLEHNQNNFDKF